jgi:hypothetical protein
MTPARPLVAPPAPGSLDDAPDSRELLAYLPALLDWRDRIRERLDDLDRRARATTDPAKVVADVTLAYALWQSIATRVDAIVATWDSGRVGDRERERIAELLWGRLGGNVDVVLAVSFAEACVLADALTERLAVQLDADPLGAVGVGDRIDELRAQLRRCREYDAADTETTGVLDALGRELDAVVDAAARGVDPREALARIEATAATLERDLIIAAATRSAIGRDAVRLRTRLDAASARAKDVGELAQRCREKIASAPNLAVPDPAAIGPVPATDGDWRTVRASLDAYEERLSLVERALQEAEQRYHGPLARRDELRGLIGAYRAMAARHGHAEDAKLHDEYERARAVLWSAPLDLDRAAGAVAAYEHAVRAALDGGTRREEGPT